MIKPKKYVWGSSALPRVFLGILVHTGTSVGEHLVRQTSKSYGSM